MILPSPSKAVFLHLSRPLKMHEPPEQLSRLDSYQIVTAGKTGPIPETLLRQTDGTARQITAWDGATSLTSFCQSHGINPGESFYLSDLSGPLGEARNGGLTGLILMAGPGGGAPGAGDGELMSFHCLADALSWITRDEDPLGRLESEITGGAQRLKEGGVVAFPTETVYGLGADALNPEAVKQIFALKGRPHFNPLIAHVASRDQLEALVTRIPENALLLMDRFWPGPLTLVFPKKPDVPDITTGGNPTVAVRMPRHPVARELLRQAGTPVAAPGANAFGKTSPTTAAHVREQLGPGDYALIDGGGCQVGLESTVVSVTGKVPRLLRPGGITREELEEVVGPLEVPAAEDHPVLKNAPLESPGLLASHYAPKTPLFIKENLPARNDDPGIGVILRAPDGFVSAGPVVILSQTGSLEEAAAHLYAALRRLDKMGLKEIWAPRFPESGVGHALNDRLSKAAYKKAQQ